LKKLNEEKNLEKFYDIAAFKKNKQKKIMINVLLFFPDDGESYLTLWKIDETTLIKLKM
jgi:hypothetical protein